MIRVLLAEDQAMVLGALAALLEIEADLTVVGRARDGKEALELARAERPDVVVTDIEMPGMTGLELAAELKRLEPRPRVIIVTTFARPGYLRRALEAGRLRLPAQGRAGRGAGRGASAGSTPAAGLSTRSWRPRPGARGTR